MRIASTIRPWSAGFLSRQCGLGQATRRVWVILCLAVKQFFQIDGSQWAGAFAFNAFFSLFPLMVLLLWIYVCGCVFIFGASLCAGRAESLGQPAGTTTAPAGEALPR